MRFLLSIFMVAFCQHANAILLTDPEDNGFGSTGIIITSEKVFYGCKGVEDFLKNDYQKLITLYENRVKRGVDKRYKETIKKHNKRLKVVAEKISKARTERLNAVSSKALLEASVFAVSYFAKKGISSTGISNKEIRALETLSGKASALGKEIASGVLNNDIDYKSFSLDVVLDNGELLLKATGRHPAAETALMFVRLAKAGHGISVVYRDTNIEVQFLKAKRSVIYDSLKSLYMKLPEQRVKDLKRTERILRNACEPGALLERQ